jgi:glyoxylase-like metal-dependent hydrolase (beta-lactamase superfamily II)
VTALQTEVGRARISVLNGGDLRANMRDWLRRPDQDVDEADVPATLSVPVQCVHIALDDASVLIDASRFDPADAPIGYAPPPPLTAQLRAIGAPPESITHVLITHPHIDHISALVDPVSLQLSFSNAFHYIGRKDWHDAEARAADNVAYAKQIDGLRRVADANLLMRINGDRQIAPGIFALATPGETPGHYAARVHSAGHTLYALGDLYHHPIEIERNWVTYWADAPTKRASRAGLCIAALQEDPLLVATHIRGFGKLEFSADTIRWRAIDTPAAL